MTKFCGFADPSAERSGSLTVVNRMAGPVKGDPTPPGGQKSPTNRAFRNAASQADAGVKMTFKGIWADPKAHGGMRTGPARSSGSTTLVGAARESGKS